MENYNIKIEEAKQIEGFKITWNIPYDEAIKILKNSNRHEELLELDCICCIEFKNIDIEFMCYGLCDVTHYPVCQEEFKGISDIGFFVCCNTKSVGWESHGFTDLEVNFNFDILNDKKLLEETMFNSMMEYAKKNELYWSELNE